MAGAQPPHEASPEQVSLPPGEAPITLKGIGAAPGSVYGPALLYTPPGALPVEAETVTDPERERARLEEALAAAIAQLQALVTDLTARGAAEEAGIFDAQAMMLQDPTITERADALITQERLSAASALSQAAEEQAQMLAALPDPLWQARAADVRDAAMRATRFLAPHVHIETLAEALTRLPTPAIVVAEDLAPSDTAQAPADRLLGIALARGGTTSHAAILARALGIPAVVGLGVDLPLSVRDGDPLALDGAAGRVIVRPSTDEVAAARSTAEVTRQRQAEARLRNVAWRERPGATRDGVRIPLMANVGSIAEAHAAADVGAEGIGLLRTEFLFAGRETLPTADEQAALYADILTAFGAGHGPVIIRTLDAGADKPLPSLSLYTSRLPTEANPALGIRGLRLSQRFETLLDTQLEGIAIAAATTGIDTYVMLPMVATVEELEAAHRALDGALLRLRDRGLEPRSPLRLGIMVETPAAALCADALAERAAFFSIGANDLTQYVMAADRLHPELADMRRPEQPAVLRAIRLAARAGATKNIPVAVCGEMAGEPLLALLLVGLGVTELSMTPASITPVKEALATWSLDDLRAIATRAADATTLAGALQIIDDLSLSAG